jgi:Mn2+/Fe2+ NRAMP family transporter
MRHWAVPVSLSINMTTYKPSRSVLLGAAFLMATSAIGPGFITQTTEFTQRYLASFGFIILLAVLLDIGVQLNIWRIISVSGMYAQDIANKVLRGSGHLLIVLVALGGLAFNIGNIAGCGLGLQLLTGWPLAYCVLASCAAALFIFLVKEAGRAMDLFAKLLGVLMLLLVVYVAWQSHPPLAEALKKSFAPDVFSESAMLTIVGGTVGGYICFSGAHRLLQAGISGQAHLQQVSGNAVTGIMLATAMRIVLFLAALGVVSKGIQLDAVNPAATVFSSAAGQAGLYLFGIVLWSAAITSVTGSAYTSVSFLQSLHPAIKKNYRTAIVVFISISTIIFLLIGKPKQVLLVAGALNGLILPVSLSLILLAAYNKKIIGSYRHPVWMAAFGWLVVLAMLYMSVVSISHLF